MTHRPVAIGFAAMALLVACNSSTTTTKEPEIADRSFTTALPCAAPCWYNLELNQANKSDVLAKLKELDFVDPDTIRITNNGRVFPDKNWVLIEYRCVEPNDWCGSLALADNLLQEVNIQLNYGLSLQSVVDQLGQPAFVKYGPWGPHGEGCMLDFIWPDKSIKVQSVDMHSGEQCTGLESGKPLDPSTLATEIFYIADVSSLSVGAQCPACVTWPIFDGP